MRVLSVASEIFPLIKTGGLADVAGALPGALGRRGVSVRSLVPGYPKVLGAFESAEPVHAFADLFGGPARLLAGSAAGLDLLVLDAPHLYARPGNPYVDDAGRDWSDNAQRFAALCQAAAQLGQGVVPMLRPDVVHAHDWQAGLVPAYLHYGGGARPGAVVTVHNMAFQGSFPAHLLNSLGLPPRSFVYDGVEYHGRISFLKAGLQLADRITTVSPTYAVETTGPEFGMGLDGLLQARAAVYSGILNGIDTDVWNPATDPHLPARFSARSPRRRALNKRALQARFGLAESPGTMLFGVISRLSWQKGLDLLLAALPDIVAQDAQLVVLGAGDQQLQNAFVAAASSMPGRVGVYIGYDESLAHLVQGGADALLVPSRFEPCGLTQLCAQRYGAVPVVARVGGLNDTVIDANEMALAAGVATGLQFSPVTREALAGAISRTAVLWKDRKAWRRMQANGLAAEVGWDRPAARYVEVYKAAATAHGWRPRRGRTRLRDAARGNSKRLRQKGPAEASP
jgi:starch synthase